MNWDILPPFSCFHKNHCGFFFFFNSRFQQCLTPLGCHPKAPGSPLAMCLRGWRPPIPLGPPAFPCPHNSHQKNLHQWLLQSRSTTHTSNLEVKVSVGISGLGAQSGRVQYNKSDLQQEAVSERGSSRICSVFLRVHWLSGDKTSLGTI